MKNAKKTTAVLMVSIVLCCFLLPGCSQEPCEWCFDNPSYYTYSTEKTSTATCTEEGSISYTCRHCRKTETLPQEALGHDWNCYSDESTCIDAGMAYYACRRENCSAKKQELHEADPSKHRLLYDDGIFEGNTVYYKCEICGELIPQELDFGDDDTPSIDDDSPTISYGTKVSNTTVEFFYATGATIKIVENVLNYPSMSSFQKERDMTVYYNRIADKYTVQGYVDAANLFGSKRRLYFTARFTIRFVSGGAYYTWEDVELDI